LSLTLDFVEPGEFAREIKAENQIIKKIVVDLMKETPATK
jgi:hypothetical protein